MRKASEAGLHASLFNAKALSLKLRNSQMNLAASFAFRDFPSLAFNAVGVRGYGYAITENKFSAAS
jgi:hypothetical protein